MPTVSQVTTEARKPFLATVGLGQLAVASARSLPKTVPAELSKLQEQARQQVKALPSLSTTVQEQVKALPAVVISLPNQASSTVKTRLETYSSKAEEVYTDLVARGEKLVGAVRRQPSTQAAEASVTQTVRSAKATTTSAKKAVKATEQATGDAAAKV